MPQRTASKSDPPPGMFPDHFTGKGAVVERPDKTATRMTRDLGPETELLLCRDGESPSEVV